LQGVPIDWSAIGRKVERRLPAGPIAFTRGGDEATGAYDALSLHSPVKAFASPEAARREAERLLHRLFDPPAQAERAEQPESPDRRAFLRGGARGA